MMFSSLLSSIVTRISAHRSYVRTLRALEALSDRELYDLGLSRGSIDSVARSAA